MSRYDDKLRIFLFEEKKSDVATDQHTWGQMQLSPGMVATSIKMH